MPPPLLVDLSQIDLNRVIITREEIYRLLPHRYEFMQLDGVIHLNTEAGTMVTYRNVREDEWWVRGHIPGRPIFPGVLMIETAAQMAAYYTKAVLKDDRFWGFGGVDKVKFRDAVIPPCRLIMAGKSLEVRSRRSVCAVQGLVDNKLVFEAQITGMPV